MCLSGSNRQCRQSFIKQRKLHFLLRVCWLWGSVWNTKKRAGSCSARSAVFSVPRLLTLLMIAYSFFVSRFFFEFHTVILVLKMSLCSWKQSIELGKQEKYSKSVKYILSSVCQFRWCLTRHLFPLLFIYSEIFHVSPSVALTRSHNLFYSVDHSYTSKTGHRQTH